MIDSDVQIIPIASVIRDKDLQIRERLDMNMVDRYAEIMKDAGGTLMFPPIRVFRCEDEGKFFLADGHHRIAAAVKSGHSEITALIYNGDRQDAVWASLSANRTNGVGLTHGDVKRAVTIALTMFPSKSNRLIADAVGCSHTYVNNLRSQLETSGLEKPDKRVDKNEKEYSPDKRSIIKDTKEKKPPVKHREPPQEKESITARKERIFDLVKESFAELVLLKEEATHDFYYGVVVAMSDLHCKLYDEIMRS